MGAEGYRCSLEAIQRGFVDMGTAVWLDLGVYGYVGMGSLPLWRMDLCRIWLGLGTRAGKSVLVPGSRSAYRIQWKRRLVPSLSE